MHSHLQSPWRDSGFFAGDADETDAAVARGGAGPGLRIGPVRRRFAADRRSGFRAALAAAGGPPSDADLVLRSRLATVVLVLALALSACGGSEVVVQVYTEQDGQAAPVPGLEVRALPYDRDAIFDSLRAESQHSH